MRGYKEQDLEGQLAGVTAEIRKEQREIIVKRTEALYAMQGQESDEEKESKAVSLEKERSLASLEKERYIYKNKS